MISKIKIIRDLIIIVIVVAVGVVAWHMLYKPRPDNSQDISHMMDTMKDIPAVEGDGTEFEIGNPEIAIKVNDKEFSIGEIDERAQTHFHMINTGKVGLTKELRSEARRKAVLNIRREIAFEKAVTDFNLEITDTEIESLMNEIKNSLSDQGSFSDVLSRMNITEERLKIRLRKDEIENRVFLAFIEQKKLTGSELSVQQEAFSKWIDEQIQNLEFDVLSAFLEELSPPASTRTNMNPHGMGMAPVKPDEEEKTSESTTSEKQGN